MKSILNCITNHEPSPSPHSRDPGDSGDTGIATPPSLFRERRGTELGWGCPPRRALPARTFFPVGVPGFTCGDHGAVSHLNGATSHRGRDSGCNTDRRDRSRSGSRFDGARSAPGLPAGSTAQNDARHGQGRVAPFVFWIGIYRSSSGLPSRCRSRQTTALHPGQCLLSSI
jgi:hypothetical protein